MKAAIKNLLIKTLSKSGLYRNFFHIPKTEVVLNQIIDKYDVVFSKKVNKGVRVPPITQSGRVEPEFINVIELNPQPIFLIKGKNWHVWGNRGAVLTDKNLLLKDVSREFENPHHTIFKQLKVNQPKLIPGTVAIIAASGAEMYYHWMFDILPRFDILDKLYGIEKIHHFIINYSELPFQKESLKELGISESKILRSNDTWNFHVQPQLLVVPSLPSRLDEVSQEACNFLIKTFLTKPVETPRRKRLYLKRTNKRRIINEQEIEAYFLNQGFETIMCDELTIKEQALLFYNADIVAGPHGAAFTNIVFCKKGTKIIEFFSPMWVNPCYWTICCEVGLTYFYLLGEGSKPEKRDAKGTTEDIFLDLIKVKSFMAKHVLNLII